VIAESVQYFCLFSVQKGECDFVVGRVRLVALGLKHSALSFHGFSTWLTANICFNISLCALSLNITNFYIFCAYACVCGFAWVMYVRVYVCTCIKQDYCPLDSQRAGRCGDRILFGRGFQQWSRPVLGPTQPPVQWVPSLFPGIKRPGHGVDHPSRFSAEVKQRAVLYLYSCLRLYDLLQGELNALLSSVMRYRILRYVFGTDVSFRRVLPGVYV
jgi:hypothetical protein